jgi:aldehyde:ferredoxin oxidoreductase
VTADPLGPQNILGLMPGIPTGTPLFGNRFQAVGKTPKTGGWGDSNCGGDFGPVLKHAGWDGLLFSGISEKPVYLLIEDEKAELRDADDLWGMDAIEVEKALKVRHGKRASGLHRSGRGDRSTWRASATSTGAWPGAAVSAA